MLTSVSTWINTLSLKRKALLFVAIPFAMQAFVISVYTIQADRYEKLSLNQFHTKELIGRVNWLSCLFLSSALGAVTSSVTHDPEYAELYKLSNEQLESERNNKDLKALIELDPKQVQYLDAMFQDWAKIRVLLDACISAQTDQLAKIISGGSMKTLWPTLYQARQRIMVEQQNSSFAVTTTDLLDARHFLKSLLNDIVIADFLVALGLFYSFRQIVRRVSVIADNSKRLVSGEPLNQPISGKDEIQALDSTFHSMATQLTQARLNLEANEKRIKDILNNMPDGLLVLNGENVIEFANTTAGVLLKYQTADLRGKVVSEVMLLEEGNLSVDAIVQKSLAGAVEIPFSRSDRTNFQAEIAGNSIEFAEGTRTLVSIKDVTERHELENLKKEFVAMVCHDLRNPLTSVMLFHQMLEKKVFGEMNDSGMKILTNAQKCTESLMTLVNDMLESQKLEDTAVPTILARAKLDTIIEQAIASSDGALKARQIEVDYSPVNLELDCDEMKIVRVIGNLIGNAAKFSPKKSKIKIDSSVTETEVRVAVIDEGCGISEEMQGKIFDKFTQVSAGNARLGVGLGLSICKKFVEGHGGRIGVISKPGEGSSFWFTLPLVK